MGEARALVQAPLDRWRFSGHFGISHISMTSAVFELWSFSLFTAGWGARVLVHVPLDRWRFSGNFGKLYVSMT